MDKTEQKATQKIKIHELNIRMDMEKNKTVDLQGRRSTWQNTRTWSIPPPTNTSKIDLHVEQFLQNNY